MQTDSWAFDFSLSVLVLSELGLDAGEFTHKQHRYRDRPYRESSIVLTI